ncbi:hypothetical protein HK100_004394, partial [Physocladia obscura]
MSELRFDNRVVIVTGTGGGASVVVNDLGGSRAFDGQREHKAADIIVNDIVAAGGKAIANYDSVEEGDKIVETPVKAFGKVNIVINNAVSLRKCCLADWKIEDFSEEVQHPQSIAEVDWVGLLDVAKLLKLNSAGPNLKFNSKVAVVTGAGAGLGRDECGPSHSGTGTGHNAADLFVNELRTLGAKDVANYDSVEDGDNVFETTIKTFGCVDIVINNAKILRDNNFARVTDVDMYTCVTWPYFLKQKYGRVVNTTLAVEFNTLVLALEGRKSNIITIAPNAGTSMTATAMPLEMAEALKPDYIAP